MSDIKIGNLILKNPFILAPLAGITDYAMRSICFEQGAALAYTEMVSAKGIYYGDKKTDSLLYMGEDEATKDRPLGIQIFGSDAEIMGKVAYILNKRKNQTLDINMGCPVPKVVKNGDGSALMKDPDKIYNIVKSVVGNTDKPVTVKIRKGFDENNINAVQVGKAIEDGGAVAITIHGRTREEYYSGKADWNIIKTLADSIKIPVIGNGDIFSAEDGMNMLASTGVKAIMIARGAMGNPWIFRNLNETYMKNKITPPIISEISDMMMEHLDKLIQLKGEFRAIKEIRKHIGWYTKGLPNSSKLRNKINNINDLKEMKEALKIG